MDEWILEIESTPCEEAVKIMEKAAKDLEYYKNLVYKAATGLRGSTPILEEVLPVGKILSNSITCYRDVIHERKSQTMRHTSLL